jgi:hypothetical protein
VRPTEPERPYSVLSGRTIAWAGIGLVLLGFGLAILLLALFGDGKHSDQLDAIKTASTIVVGTGGAAALWLAARRQRTNEIALNQKHVDQQAIDRAFKFNEFDAEARRVTDGYGKAVEQIGSDKAAVRMAGFYALERLAQDNPGQRLAIVNVLCAYLRMPFDTDAHEHEVRQAVQRILTRHLRPGNDPALPLLTFWAGVEVDLTGAELLDFDASGCAFGSALFSRAIFTGPTKFDVALFGGYAEFGRVQFKGYTTFNGTNFIGQAVFGEAAFEDVVWFEGAVFNSDADFTKAVFKQAAGFTRAAFHAWALFGWASFDNTASFDSARFSEAPAVLAAAFGGDALFRETAFGAHTTFLGTRFTTTALFDNATFAGTCYLTGPVIASSGIFSAQFVHDPVLADPVDAGEIGPGTVLEIPDGRVIVDWQGVAIPIATSDDGTPLSAAGLALQGPDGIMIPLGAPRSQPAPGNVPDLPEGPLDTEWDECVQHARTTFADRVRENGLPHRFRVGELVTRDGLRDSALARWDLGDFINAVDDLTTLIKLDPVESLWLCYRGQILADVGYAAFALLDLDAAIGMGLQAPADAWALSARGYAQGMLGRHEEALRDFENSLRIVPGSAWVYFRRGLLLTQAGRDAESDLRTSLTATEPGLTPLQAAKARSMLEGSVTPATTAP